MVSNGSACLMVMMNMVDHIEWLITVMTVDNDKHIQWLILVGDDKNMVYDDG